MQTQLIDNLGKPPFEILSAVQLAEAGLITIPAAVAATIIPGLYADPEAGSPTGNYTATAGTLTGGNVTLATGVTGLQVPGVVKKTRLCLKALPLTITDALTYAGVEIADFPKGRILVLGVVSSLCMTTTSAIASTLNSGVTVSHALGSAVASGTTLNSTMADLAPAVNLTSSTVINVPPATVSNALASSAQFDGTVTAKKMFLNVCVTTNTDIDADATVVFDGFIEITWINLGVAKLVNGA